MNKDSVWSLVVLTAFALMAGLTSAHADVMPIPERIEVPVGNVFIPPKGFDDNDNIEFVVDGFLPNACYAIANTTYEIIPDKKLIVVHQFASHRKDGICADENSLPIHLREMVPFDVNVSLGSLGTGDYSVQFSRGANNNDIRTFNVEKAKVAAVDNMPYAAVSSVSIPDMVRGDLDIKATLIGVTTSSCSELSPVVSVKLENDVFVVLPTLDFKPNVRCAFVMRPFERTISLGKTGEGRYLLHIRSMNGKSVNRAFSVVKPDEPDGHPR